MTIWQLQPVFITNSKTLHKSSPSYLNYTWHKIGAIFSDLYFKKEIYCTPSKNEPVSGSLSYSIHAQFSKTKPWLLSHEAVSHRTRIWLSSWRLFWLAIRILFWVRLRHFLMHFRICLVPFDYLIRFCFVWDFTFNGAFWVFIRGSVFLFRVNEFYLSELLFSSHLKVMFVFFVHISRFIIGKLW